MTNNEQLEQAIAALALARAAMEKQEQTVKSLLEQLSQTKTGQALHLSEIELDKKKREFQQCINDIVFIMFSNDLAGEPHIGVEFDESKGYITVQVKLPDEDIRATIKKPVQKCQCCRWILQPNTDTCPNCGYHIPTPLVIGEEETDDTCPDCGATVPYDATACPQCGKENYARKM